MLNLSVLLEDAARETPDREAVVFGDLRLSYSFIDSVANQVANLLRSRGIGPATRWRCPARTSPTSRWSTSGRSRPARWSSR